MTDDGAKLIANALMEIARQMKIKNLLNHECCCLRKYPQEKRNEEFIKLMNDMFFKSFGDFSK